MMMDYDLGDDAGQLRQHLRELISNNVPADFLGACTEDPQDLATTETFCKLLAVEGLLALAWPKEHGGGGGSVWHQTVLREEMWAQHEPRGPQYMGINWVGPALMRYGTAEQKAKHLAAIASGDVIWCQGFSEPEAGSDLASLRTRAIPDGDGWRINGQKVWTSYAGMASDPHGQGGFHRPPDPLDVGSPPPQRDVLGRRAGAPRRCPRRRG
jgi:alkylation response protein AidB-like acyl-CoA dehydrogenase